MNIPWPRRKKYRFLFGLMFFVPPLLVIGGMIFIQLVAWVYPFASPPPLPPSALLVYDRSGQELAAMTNAHGRWHLPESDPSPQRDWLDLALIAVEDHRFDQHNGIDWHAVAAAAWSNLLGKPRRGASTIAMQVMRLRHQRPRHSGSKIIEMCEALHWHQQQGKQALLSEYRSRAPFGGNIVGTEAAAWRYYGKQAKDLSLGEAALLAGLPQSPERLRPDRHPTAAKQRRNTVLECMIHAGFITQKDAEIAKKSPLPRELRPLPQRNHYGLLPAITRNMQQWGNGVQHSSLSLADAHNIEQSASFAQHRGAWDSMAVVAVDLSHNEIRAAWSQSSEAWLATPYQRRSLGSTIKPFIVAEALAQGWYQFDLPTEDLPLSFTGWAPLNADHMWTTGLDHGRSLAYSRNIPALRTLQRAGIRRVAGLARALGLRGVIAEQSQLSLGVGTVLGSPLELAQAYAALAQDGAFNPLRWRRNEQVEEGTAILPPHSGELIFQRLASPERTRVINGEAAQRGIAWKTGTSSGNRDGWCVALNQNTLCVVWIGNANGLGHPSINGLRAAPIALDILGRLDPRGKGWLPPRTTPSRSTTTPAQGYTAPARSIRPQNLELIHPVEGDIIHNGSHGLFRAHGTGTLHWFINDHYVGQSVAAYEHSYSWPLTEGRHELRVIDQNGHSRGATFTVLRSTYSITPAPAAADDT